MSLYSSYDAFYASNPSPSQLGGNRRAQSATRDRFGRFMPSDEWRHDLWELPERHGVAGGKARAATAKRERGKFTRN